MKDRSALARGGTRFCAAALLTASGALHLDLYLTGYRTIPTIGWLFLLQVISAFALAALVLATDHWLVAGAGAGFCLATIAGYLLSTSIGLFGFKEVSTEAGAAAGAVEVAACALLSYLCISLLPRRSGRAAGRPARRRGALLGSGPPVIAGVGLLVAALVVAPSGPAGGRARGGVVVKTALVHGVRVLTNSKGFTLYWFALDKAGESACTGACASYWPPLLGRAIAGPGLTGRFGTLGRPGGATQVSYDGHPLYTYVGDSAPGENHGNGIDLNGGYWYEARPSAGGH